MKTVTIHLTHCNAYALHTDAIHLKKCKAFGKVVTINVLSDGQSILTSEANEPLKP